MPKCILIADDNDIVRTITRFFLETKGFGVCEAVDGVDAIEKAKQLNPDLIVLDVAMPRMNGVEAASVLKAMMPEVPIVWFTMYQELVGHSLTAAVGVDAVLSKPDGVGGLVECVQGLIG
jgi:two-component system alkaline phosphatase synthesis response regulator PhoP